jgi:hypothetical protein
MPLPIYAKRLKFLGFASQGKEMHRDCFIHITIISNLSTVTVTIISNITIIRNVSIVTIVSRLSIVTITIISNITIVIITIIMQYILCLTTFP